MLPRLNNTRSAAARRGPSPQVRRLSSIRWSARVPRVAFVVALAFLAAAGLRAALAPLAPVRSSSSSKAAVDGRPAEAFAEAFARAYLTWDSQDPDAHRAAVAPFLPRE